MKRYVQHTVRGTIGCITGESGNVVFVDMVTDDGKFIGYASWFRENTEPFELRKRTTQATERNR